MAERRDSGQFEADWREALRDAQMEPPKAVWQELDQALTHAELVAIKKRLATYKWATIAAIVFALIAAMIALTSRYDFSLGDAPGDIVMLPKGYQSPEDQFLEGKYAGYAILRSSPPNPQWPATSQREVRATTRQASVVRDDDTLPLVVADESSRYADSREIHPVVARREVAPFSGETIDPSDWWVQRVPDYRYYRPTRDKEELAPANRKFWAALNLGTGYYNPNYQGDAQLDFVNEIFASEGEAGKQSDIPELSESMKGGASYMLGFNMGMNVTRRWSLEGGMQYSLQGARSLSNLILESDKFNRAMALSSEVIGVNAVTALTEDALTVLSADETELNNTFQFVTLPLQAGYLLVDRRMSVRINGGLAANLYLGNTIGGTDRVSGVEISRENSPYRAVSLGTITGVEFGYRIFDQFHLSIEPVYQRSLQSLTKSSSNFVTNPSTIGVETGLKFTF
ncbi:MAG: outer membrane beta-barrel protein [Bacteroidota bacterium]